MPKLFKQIQRAWQTGTSRRLERARRRRRTPRPSLFVTAFPKSGSSFLVGALAEVTGYFRYFLGQSYLAEHDLYLPRLLDAAALPTVSHHHAKANVPNLEYMEEFAIRPVVLTRSIDDCLVSLRDHLHGESPLTPTFNAPPGFFDLDEPAQFDCLVDLAAPWYFDFHVSWSEAIASGRREALWLTYEQMMADKPAALRSVLEFHRLPVDPEAIDAAIAKLSGDGTKTRLNVGISGRGRERLSPAQRGRLDAMARHYGWIDYARMGIPLG